MATYAIGDVQGCFEPLMRLLEKIHFDPICDKLWFVGDLINRGPQSLEVIDFVRGLGNNAITVLGNHELHFLAIGAGLKTIRREDTLQRILDAPHFEQIFQWLRHLPLLHYDPHVDFLMVHAGLPPQWDLATASTCAREVAEALQSDDYLTCLSHMYGNEPTCWHDSLQGVHRLRFIINSLTRLRYCDNAGNLDLKAAGPLGTQPEGYMPWFEIKNRASKDLKIVFGHWASLVVNWDSLSVPGIYPVDSGCIWGERLSALRLEDQKRFDIGCG